jgi:DUF2075 family protein
VFLCKFFSDNTCSNYVFEDNNQLFGFSVNNNGISEFQYDLLDKIKKNLFMNDRCRKMFEYNGYDVYIDYFTGFKHFVKDGKEDIELCGNKYVWNMSNQEWILRQDAVNEIGCIHTTQGYDLNYVGVILGREIDYDPLTNSITINRNLFYDAKVKANVDDETLKTYIVNSYKVMMTRGIKGCYLYACNSNLQKYLKGYFMDR